MDVPVTAPAPLPALTDLPLDGWAEIEQVPGARRFTAGRGAALGPAAGRPRLRGDVRRLAPAAQRLHGPLAHPPRHAGGHAPERRRHAGAAHPPRRRPDRRVGVHSRGRAQHAVPVQPGRLRRALPLLRQRRRGPDPQPLGGRDARAGAGRRARRGPRRRSPTTSSWAPRASRRTTSRRWSRRCA